MFKLRGRCTPLDADLVARCEANSRRPLSLPAISAVTRNEGAPSRSCPTMYERNQKWRLLLSHEGHTEECKNMGRNAQCFSRRRRCEQLVESMN
jgi:hypothetical protein